MNSIITELKPLLTKKGYEFREENESIFVELPNGFGELQIYDIEDDDDIIGLSDSDWHTHSECIGDPDTPKADKALKFIIGIFSGDYLLIEEQESGKAPRKTIEDDLKSYLEYLPEGTKYEIYNQT